MTHGDVVATADGAGAKQGATISYDPYGQALGALPDNSAGNLDYGWLGGHQRGTEHEGGIATIEMGARQYVPGLGRFLDVDPVEGGCANDYAYVFGDPLNHTDLTGTAQTVATCGGASSSQYFAIDETTVLVISAVTGCSTAIGTCIVMACETGERSSRNTVGSMSSSARVSKNAKAV